MIGAGTLFPIDPKPQTLKPFLRLQARVMNHSHPVQDVRQDDEPRVFEALEARVWGAGFGCGV